MKLTPKEKEVNKKVRKKRKAEKEETLEAKMYRIKTTAEKVNKAIGYDN